MSHSLLINRPVANYLEAVITEGQTLTASVSKKLEIDAPIFNDCFTDSSDTFTCTKSGVYAFHFTFYKNAATNSNLWVTLNGSEFCLLSARSDFIPVATFVVNLTVGDIVEFWAVHGTGGTGGWLGNVLAVRLQ